MFEEANKKFLIVGFIIIIILVILLLRELDIAFTFSQELERLEEQDMKEMGLTIED